MNSSVPYLIRAINEWILDNDSTPYLIVDATMEDVSVPMEYVKDGQIVLNISPKAVRDLSISTEYVMFSGRFAGIAHGSTRRLLQSWALLRKKMAKVCGSRETKTNLSLRAASLMESRLSRRKGRRR